MSRHFATLPVSNTTSLCIGGVTRNEAAEARAEGLPVEDDGFYLFLASSNEPSRPIEILARFFSVDQAERLMAHFTER
jgi:hypothetical protein